MKTRYFIYAFAFMLFVTACGESGYDRNSESGELQTDDTTTGFQTGANDQPIADPNAANTIRTPVPMDSVVVDTNMPR